VQFRTKARPHPSSPQGEGELLYLFQTFTNFDSFQPGQMVLPLLGERAGVRANFIFNWIVTALGGHRVEFYNRLLGECSPFDPANRIGRSPI